MQLALLTSPCQITRRTVQFWTQLDVKRGSRLDFGREKKPITEPRASPTNVRIEIYAKPMLNANETKFHQREQLPQINRPEKPPMKRQANPRTKRTRTKRLTRRERSLFAGVASGLTITEAAVRAGYTKKCPAQAGSPALKNISEKLPDLFELHGLSDDQFIEKHLLPALNATEVKILLHRGKIRYSKPLIAWGPRVRIIELIARMKGLIAKERDTALPGFKVVLINAQHRPARELPRSPIEVGIPRDAGLEAGDAEDCPA